jgi:hypothetical protein
MQMLKRRLSVEKVMRTACLLLKTPRGAGEGCFRGLNEVSLALVGVDLPGLIPILVYEIWNCKTFFQNFTD